MYAKITKIGQHVPYAIQNIAFFYATQNLLPAVSYALVNEFDNNVCNGWLHCLNTCAVDWQWV